MKVTDVAKWFYKNNEQTKKNNKDGNVVMQKLCYYAQAMHIAVYGEPLFEERIEAWENGPVVGEVYKLYRWYNLMLNRETQIDIDEKDELILKVVNSVYGFKTAQELIESTHSEKPWKQYESVSKDRNNNPEIKKEDLREYYSSQLDIYEANKENDFENETMYKYLNCNFIYNKNNITDISPYVDRLKEIALQQVKAKSFNIYLEEGNELVIYD